VGEPLTITKLEAAERQLRQAIQLFFGGGDEVAVHTLTGAACEILRDLAAHRGILHPLGIVLPLRVPARERKRSRFYKLLTRHQNFFKPADRDPEGRVTFDPETTALFLFEATATHRSLAGYVLPETFAFEFWFILQHPDIVPAGPFKDLIGKLDVHPTGADHATVLELVDRLRMQHGEHIPALPWK
jgi:hypothetical protein